MATKRKSRQTPVAQVSGRIIEFRKSDKGWTFSVQFKPELRPVCDSIVEVCRGMRYLSAKLDAETARQLQEAFEAGHHISYDPDLMKSLAWHTVPWQDFVYDKAKFAEPQA